MVAAAAAVETQLACARMGSPRLQQPIALHCWQQRSQFQGAEDAGRHLRLMVQQVQV